MIQQVEFQLKLINRMRNLICILLATLIIGVGSVVAVATLFLLRSAFSSTDVPEY